MDKINELISNGTLTRLEGKFLIWLVRNSSDSGVYKITLTVEEVSEAVGKDIKLSSAMISNLKAKGYVDSDIPEGKFNRDIFKHRNIRPSDKFNNLYRQIYTMGDTGT